MSHPTETDESRASVREKVYSLSNLLFSDFHANRRNPKGLLVAVLYRIAHSCVDFPKSLIMFEFVIVLFYKIITEYIIGTEIHWRCVIGPGLRVFHGYGLVVHSSARIGERCVLRHGVTIGEKETAGAAGAPVIGDDVDIGASAIILGPISVGSGSVVGAGSVVVRDVPPGSVVVGNPARVIRTKKI